MAIKIINPIISEATSEIELQEKTITENGEYTADEGYDGLSKVTVDVKGGGVVSAEPKYINFFDYDGTILYSYTEEELTALTELPPLPEHEGLICQEWNWTLADIKAEGKPTNVGAIYNTDDGSSRFYIRIKDIENNKFTLHFGTMSDGTMSIDWGDGSEATVVTSSKDYAHEYNAVGEYVVSISSTGVRIYPDSDSSYNMFGRIAENVGSAMKVYKVEVGSNWLYLNCYDFAGCANLEFVTLHTKCYNNSNYNWQNCYSLKHLNFPRTYNTFSSNWFVGCSGLRSVAISKAAAYMQSNFFKNCYNLRHITIPSSITNYIDQYVFENCVSIPYMHISPKLTKIGAYCFKGCEGMGYIDFSRHTSVPTLSGSNAFQYCSSDLEIRVPSSLLATWKSATNWSAYADYIVGV